MSLLNKDRIALRALEPLDIDLLLAVENNTDLWFVSESNLPLSKAILESYIENASQDIYEAKQLRLVVEETTNSQAIGLIDLFDFTPQHKRAGIGVLIHEQYQKAGFASEALALLIPYCFKTLHLHQLFANITPDNQHSIALFMGYGFKNNGEKKDWLYVNGAFKNELIFQLMNE